MAEPATNIEPAGAQKELMVFSVGSQEFSVEVTAVREARRFTPAARLPHAPGYVRGVINLRGTILPIVDLRARLNLPEAEEAEKSVVVVIALAHRLLGILVDAVCDIVTVAEDAIGPAPAVEDEAMRELVKSVITVGERIIGLLSLEHMLPASEASL